MTTPSGRTCFTGVSSRRSTPRLFNDRRAYSRSLGWNGANRNGDCSTRVMSVRAGSSSGNVTGMSLFRSSANAPAVSTPVAPPPTTTIRRSRS